jgi:hypothetical protein
MRRTHSLLLAVIISAAAIGTLPQQGAAQTVQIRTSETNDSTVRFVDRRAPDATGFAIVSTDGRRQLMLVGDAIALQLTDRGLERIGRSEESRAEQSSFARFVEGMARGGLRVLLDRALEVDLVEVGQVRLSGDRIVIENREGKPLFDQMKIDGEEFLEGFSRRDAQAFAARVNRRL